MQGIHVTHQEFRYGDGAIGSRASEVFTSLQSGRVGDDCNGHGTHVAAVRGLRISHKFDCLACPKSCRANSPAYHATELELCM